MIRKRGLENSTKGVLEECEILFLHPSSESTEEWVSLYNPAPILMPGARRSLTARLRGPTIVSTSQRIQGTSFFTRGTAQLVFPLSSGIRGNLKLRSHEVDISL